MPNAAQLFKTATTHHQAGQFAEAEKAYQQLLKLAPVHADALRLLGGLYLQTGRIPQAVETLEKAANLLPRDPETLTNAGSALRGLGRNEEAVARYNQALTVKPGYIGALNNLGGLYHETGRVPLAIDAYAQILALTPENPAAHFNYANSLLAAGRGIDAIGSYEQALKLKPDYMEAMVNLGMALSLAGKAEQSSKWLEIGRTWFDKALKADPANVFALNNLGNVLRQQGKPEEALPYYKEALRLRPDYAQASINASTTLRDLGLMEEAIESCRTAIRLKPNSADARINLGVALQDMGRHEEALSLFQEALALKPSSIDAKWNRSLSLLALGRYEEGWPLHETGLGVPHMRGALSNPNRRWQGEDLTGKRLLICSEQGLGDSLQFIRYAELCKARGATVLVFCPLALHSLFRHCAFIDALPLKPDEKDFDYHVAMMSLPFIFATTLATIPASMPYLHVGEEARAKWAGKLGDGNNIKVGLVWSGSPHENQLGAHMIDRRRSMPLELLRPLFDIKDVEFYSLQMGAGAAQLEKSDLRSRLIDLTADIKNFEDTGAIVKQLDLVITVDTSVAHLAGGLGKPVWVMSRFDACWRWLQNRPDSPWYPTARVFGQPARGDWTAVAEQVRDALADLPKKAG